MVNKYKIVHKIYMKHIKYSNVLMFLETFIGVVSLIPPDHQVKKWEENL